MSVCSVVIACAGVTHKHCRCRSILTAVAAHYKDPSNPYPGEDNSMIFELTPYLETGGINDPLTKVLEWPYVVHVYV